MSKIAATTPKTVPAMPEPNKKPTMEPMIRGAVIMFQA
ncbi:hypothetical protein amb3153 [Paramagnetospirillum magneticum AMB-1]|uniref:Uncharacterized protein n=1 Tax=Paramagnetospirillum magneticum (strain ATCC 700264 / AMB-1) TaxID=342108 RepID=Q2W2G8_PARM1|nr:hypothetical protein amb3153 [Paramagnetospirillum magneticum AMB-1]